MARLTIEQVAAPDFSSTSSILANAGKAFDSGIESAKSLLGTYQAGQQTKADNLILNDIAKLGSEEELNAYLNSDALMGKNFSPKMQETILGLRKGVLGYGQDRANIDSTTSSTSRANAAEGRTAAEYLDGVNARTERRGMTGAVVDAAIEGRTYGNGPAPSGDTSFIDYQNSGKDRKLPLADSLVSKMETVLPQMGLGFKVTSGGQDSVEDIKRTGKGSRTKSNTTNHDHGHAGDGYFYDLQTGQTVDPNSDPRVWDAITNLTAAGVGGIGHGEGYMGDGMFHIGDTNGDRVWGKSYGSETADPRLKAAWEKGMAMRGQGGSVPVTQNPAMGGGSAADALASAVTGSLYMEPDQALALLQTGYDSQAVGQDAINAAEKKRVDGQIAAGTLAAIQDPNNLTGTAVQQDMLRLPGQLPASALLAGAENAGNLAFGSLSGVVAPPVTTDPLVAAATAAAAEADANTAAKDPAFAAVQSADKFAESGDVAQALIESTGGLAEGSGLDKTYIGTQIERIATNSNVTVAQAAATLEAMTKAGIPLEDMLIGTDPDMDAAITKRAQTLYSEEALKSAADKKFEMDKTSAGRAAAELSLTTAQTQAAKLPEGSPERAAADAEIAYLKDTLLVGKTGPEVDRMFQDYIRSTGMASRLQGLSPDDPDFTRAMMQLEETIKVDKSLSGGEKELLIKKLRG